MKIKIFKTYFGIIWRIIIRLRFSALLRWKFSCNEFIFILIMDIITLKNPVWFTYKSILFRESFSPILTSLLICSLLRSREFTKGNLLLK